MCTDCIYCVCVDLRRKQKENRKSRRLLYGGSLRSICGLYHNQINEGRTNDIVFKVFLTEFIAEMGDKTQLMLIALTSKYKLRDIILGTAAAILVLNGLAVLAGGLVSEFIPAWLIKIIAALAFLYFAASTLAGDDDEEEEGSGRSRIRFAPLAVFCTFL